jgi:predicted nucleic acid-binding protein
MKCSVYIETSVVSYFTARPSRDLVVAAHQQLTREWWESALPRLAPFSSAVVLEEAARERLRVLANLPLLEVLPEVRDLADHYFSVLDIPEQARADAYHLAIATWHGMDYLVSWNCAHIVAARVRRVVHEINAGRGIETPVICTSEELMEA